MSEYLSRTETRISYWEGDARLKVPDIGRYAVVVFEDGQVNVVFQHDDADRMRDLGQTLLAAADVIDARAAHQDVA